MIRLEEAWLCVGCEAVVQLTARGECPACAARAGLLSVARVMNRRTAEAIVKRNTGIERHFAEQEIFFTSEAEADRAFLRGARFRA